MPSSSTTLRAPAEIPAALGCDSHGTAKPAEMQGNKAVSGITATSYPASYETQPALQSIHRWQRKAKVRGLIVAALTWPFRFAFGCRHSRPTLPFNNRQTCLDCGATRLYIYNSDFEHANAGIIIGKWRKHALVQQDTRKVIAEKLIANAITPKPRDGRSAVLNPGADHPLFRRADRNYRGAFGKVEDSANGVMDRWLADGSGVQE
jgi:hypothetical protein